MSSGSDSIGGAARALALAAALLLGVNLRPAITSVATLLDGIAAEFDLSDLHRSLLATLPIITFGLTAPIGPVVARRIGTSRALQVSMVVLATALVVRVLADWLLLPGTLLAGAAIMMAATLLPPYLKALDASGLWVGLSSMSFGVGAALGASLAVPLDTAMGGTGPALASWALLAVLAAAAMLPVRNGDRTRRKRRTRMSMARGTRATVVLMTAVFSLQSLLYFAVTTWLPLMLAARGADAATAGWMLAWFSLIGLVPTLIAPVIARRRGMLAWFGPGLGIVMAVGFTWFALDHTSDASVVTLLGIVQNAGFGLAMGLLVSLAADESSAGVLSAVSQGVGYAIAGTGSLALGVVRDLSGSWTASILLMAVSAAALSLCVAFAIRRRPVSLVAR